MATLQLVYTDVSASSATVHWLITDVGEIISEVGIGNEAASGTTTAPSLIYNSSSVSGLSGSGSIDVTPAMCSSGVFGCYGYGKDGAGKYWSAGGYQSIYIPFSSSTRPSDWTWVSTVSSGSVIGLTAAEWTDFCSRINAFRAYKGMSQASFTSVTRTVTPISASIVNEARTAISPMVSASSLPEAVSSGDPLSAAFFNGLKNALNSVS
nr:hypothetical protein [uncultured Ruminococcus sp.]